MSAVWMLVTLVVVFFSSWVGVLKHRIGILQQQRFERLAALERRQPPGDVSTASARRTSPQPAQANDHQRKNGVLTWTIDMS
jgi:hypothetical protein